MKDKSSIVYPWNTITTFNGKLEFNLEKEILFLALSLGGEKGEIVRGKEDPGFGCCLWVSLFGTLDK